MLFRSAGFPCKERWVRCIKRNYYQGWPGLTAAKVRRYLGKPEHFARGRQRLLKQRARATQPIASAPSSPVEEKKGKQAKVKNAPSAPIKEEKPTGKAAKEQDLSELWGTASPLGLGLPSMRKLQKHGVGVFATGDLSKLFEGDELAAQQREKLKRAASAGQAGRFPTTSAEGHTALLAMFDFGSSYIGAEPTKGSTEGELARASRKRLPQPQQVQLPPAQCLAAARQGGT